MASAQPETRAAYHHGDLPRALVDAARGLIAEQQSWELSLREVARRARVSHNAPYKHFATKHDLLAAVAVSGFEALRARMLEAADGVSTPEDRLVGIGVAYVRFGQANPAHYRLMFGTALRLDGAGLPGAVAAAADAARTVLDDAIARGAAAGILRARADDQAALQLLALSAWSLVHGLTLLLADGLAGAGASTEIAETVTRTLLDGLRTGAD